MPSLSLPGTGSPESYRLRLPQDAEARKSDSTCLRTHSPLAAETNGHRVFWTVLWLGYHRSGLGEAAESEQADRGSAGDRGTLPRTAFRALHLRPHPADPSTGEWRPTQVSFQSFKPVAGGKLFTKHTDGPARSC